MKSISKKGEILIAPCSDTSSSLFPLDQSPSEWRSCGDAYDYTWENDYTKNLIGLSSNDKLKLVNSMGFCPQRRCQLQNISNADADGTCPDGLCYTKVENGGPSFGACCFKKGSFNSGNLIGYYDKLQSAAKPIYKKSRVILGDDIGGDDETYENFINANMLYKGLIATQCPLQNTADDVKRMIIEQNITFWVQLSPFSDDGYHIPTEKSLHFKDKCQVFPNAYISGGDGTEAHKEGISNIKQEANKYGVQGDSFVFQSFMVSSYIRTEHSKLKTKLVLDEVSMNTQLHLEAKSTETAVKSHEIASTSVEVFDMGMPVEDYDRDAVQRVTIEKESDKMLWERKSLMVEHVWFHNWKDFETPQPKDENVRRCNHSLDSLFYIQFYDSIEFILDSKAGCRGYQK